MRESFFEELEELRKLAISGISPPTAPPSAPQVNSWGMREGEGVLQHLKNAYTGGKNAPYTVRAGQRTPGAFERGMRGVFKNPIGKALGIGGAVIGAGAIAHKMFSKPTSPQVQ
jgi:hypothetical protein